MKCLVAPSEFALTKELGVDAITSSVPETVGADVLIPLPQGNFGIQRKEIPHDFIISFFDGRLTRETSLLRDKCKFRLVLNEGQFRFYENGMLAKNKNLPGDYTKKQVWGMLFDLKYIKGIDYDFTRNTAETAEYIRYIAEYFSSGDKHLALFKRPAFESELFTPSVDEFHMWVLQSFNGVGPATAENIIKHFNRMPIAWDCTEDELKGVPRLSDKRVEEMYRLLPNTGKPATLPESRSPDKNKFDSLKNIIHGGSDAEGLDVP